MLNRIGGLPVWFGHLIWNTGEYREGEREEERGGKEGEGKAGGSHCWPIEIVGGVCQPPKPRILSLELKLLRTKSGGIVVFMLVERK